MKKLIRTSLGLGSQPKFTAYSQRLALSTFTIDALIGMDSTSIGTTDSVILIQMNH